MNNNNTQEILKIQLLCDIMDSLKEIERIIIEKQQNQNMYNERLNELYRKYDDLNRKFRALTPIKDNKEA
jgi:hypothetical protein